ncbi:MAG: hypothetical protein AAGE52_42205 [Myxococcota bacterium]
MNRKIDVVFVRSNLSRDHARLLKAFEMEEDPSNDRPRRPLDGIRITELRGAAVGYWAGWTFVIHSHAAFSLVPSAIDAEFSDTARRLTELSDEAFALWTMPTSQASGFALLRRGGWARVRRFENNEVVADGGRPLPFELRDEGDIDFEGWPRAASKALLGVDVVHLLDNHILSATIHAPW